MFHDKIEFIGLPMAVAGLLGLFVHDKPKAQ
jgi:hypothetical protein